MFAKLLKYEWRATRRLLGWLTAGLLGVGILGCLFMMIYNANWYKSTETGFSIIATMLILGFLFGVIIMSLYTAAMQLYPIYRFYKNKFTDEGYLTFTLPVTAEQLYWSSAVNMVIWTMIALVAVIATALLVALPGVMGENILETIFQDIAASMGTVFTGDNLLMLVLFFVVSLAYSIATPLFCITLGAVIVKKYKLLASIGIYYALNMVMGLFVSISTIASTFNGVITANSSSDIFVTSITAPNMVFMLVVAVTGYFITIRLMKQKLNLP